jgi:hypothetical protein
MQWQQVRWSPEPQVHIPAGKAKTKTDRWIPVLARLKPILEMLRLGPDDEPHLPTAYVFGNECGEQVRFNNRA